MIAGPKLDRIRSLLSQLFEYPKIHFQFNIIFYGSDSCNQHKVEDLCGVHSYEDLPGARIKYVTERVEQIIGRGNGGSILVYIGTNNADKEGTTAIAEKYRELLKTTKEARVGQIIYQK